MRPNNPISDIYISILLCIGIAFVTYLARGGEFSRQLIIVLGYGGVCNLISLLLRNYWPSWQSYAHFIVVVSGTVIFGTFHAMLWSAWTPYESDLWQLFSLLSAALFFSTLIYYFFHNREKALRYETELKQAKLLQVEHEKALVISQLQVLQSQIEPHFLFNTLANLQVLIDTDAKKANMLLERLTDLLRISLKKSRQESIMLEDEIELLDAYLGIQSIRLGERLTYQLTVDESVNKRWNIPPHMLQPLVENAVYHGIEPCKEGGEIMVHLTSQNGRIRVEIKDTGVGLDGKSMHKGNGVSLDNIRQRLIALYGDHSFLSVTSPDTGGVITKIEFIPGEYI